MSVPLHALFFLTFVHLWKYGHTEATGTTNTSHQMMNTVASRNMNIKAEKKEIVNKNDPLSIREPWIEHTQTLIKIALRGRHPAQDPKNYLCDEKFVLQTSSKCNKRFGNLLHRQINTYVIAAALGRLVILEGGNHSCKYFAGVDYTSNWSLSSRTWDKICPDRNITQSKDFKFSPPSNSYLFRCNDTIHDWDTKPIINIANLHHQNSAALFQNSLVKERWRNSAKLPYPTNFDDEIPFLQRYEIFGAVSKLIFPLRRDVKQYSIEPDPTKFDIVLGVHLRHPGPFRKNDFVKKMDQVTCRWIRRFFENQTSTKSCALLLGTEEQVSSQRVSDCVGATACSFLEIVTDNSIRRKEPGDWGDTGNLMAIRAMHAISVLSTHLFTTE